jgi:hypothetical protein
MARKIVPKTEPQVDFSNPEYAAYADKLLGVIQHYHEFIEGRTVGKEQLLEEATRIIKERLND